MGEIIPFDEAARRVRDRRSASLTATDWFWFSAIAFWPIGLALFTAQAALDAMTNHGQRR